MPSSLRFRFATETDSGLLLSLVRELAIYEQLHHEVEATEEDLLRSLFGARPYAEAVLAVFDGEEVGFAIFFHNYSTFLGKPGLYLEDLFVKPEFRQRGIGKAFMRFLAGLAVERGCGRFEWAVLDWNEPSIGFYRILGAKPMNDWTVMRLSGDSLSALALGHEPSSRFP